MLYRKLVRENYYVMYGHCYVIVASSIRWYRRRVATCVFPRHVFASLAAASREASKGRLIRGGGAKGMTERERDYSFVRGRTSGGRS